MFTPAGEGRLRFGKYEFTYGRPARQPEGQDLGECFLFEGPVNFGGYGRIKVDGRMVVVHRVIYQLTRGGLSAKRQLDHLCGNPRCCNPSHLESVLPREHVRRTRGNRAHENMQKTTCVRGHPLEGEGADVFVVMRPTGEIRRRDCRACRRIRAAEERAKERKRREARKLREESSW